jgi:glutathione S-transferase
MHNAFGDRYALYYWPSIQGRGELVRLALEEGAADYVDVARLPEARGGGVAAILQALRGEGELGDEDAAPPFAPPILVHRGHVIAQTAAILAYLGPRLGLAPASETLQIKLQQLQLTVGDLFTEVHDTHHPVSTDARYEDQIEEAKTRAKVFREKRLPKFLGYFERVLEKVSPDAPGYVLGDKLSYVDLSLFQVVQGLGYAFPKAFSRVAPQTPRLVGLAARVRRRPNIAAYFASSRRFPFSEQGIFRHYPELDG